MYVYIYIYIYMCYTCMYIYIYIYMYMNKSRERQREKNLQAGSAPWLREKGEVLLRGVGTLRYVLILGENSACRVPTCAVAG